MANKITSEICKQALADFCKAHPRFIVDKWGPDDGTDDWIETIKASHLLEHMCANPKSWIRISKSKGERVFTLTPTVCEQIDFAENVSATVIEANSNLLIDVDMD